MVTLIFTLHASKFDVHNSTKGTSSAVIKVFTVTCIYCVRRNCYLRAYINAKGYTRRNCHSTADSNLYSLNTVINH